MRGFAIPAGTTIGMSQYVMHRDPRYYPDPERFDPSRWEKDAALKWPKYCYFPFGGGPRVCVGDGFASMEALLILATLAQSWRVCSVTKTRPKLEPLITLRPSGSIPLRLERRANEVHLKKSFAACA